MGFFDRLGRLVRANANAALSAAEDPAKILDQSVADMQADLVKLRQAVATAIASQKRIQNQADQADAQAKTCLLYTSPSPRDRQKSRMPSSA